MPEAPSGMPFVFVARHFASQVEERVKSGLTEEEFELLKKLLIKMVGIFEER